MTKEERQDHFFAGTIIYVAIFCCIYLVITSFKVACACVITAMFAEWAYPVSVTVGAIKDKGDEPPNSPPSFGV